MHTTSGRLCSEKLILCYCCQGSVTEEDEHGKHLEGRLQTRELRISRRQLALAHGEQRPTRQQVLLQRGNLGPQALAGRRLHSSVSSGSPADRQGTASVDEAEDRRSARSYDAP